MPQQNIQFKGMRHAPSDITAQDGDLLDCVNLVHENGELKPIELPEQTSVRFGNGHTLSAVHNTTDGIVYVGVLNSSNRSRIELHDSQNHIVNIGDNSELEISNEITKWVETIGNTIIIGTDKSMHYVLYKNGAYKYLGDKIPQPVFEFDMTSNGSSESKFYNEFEPNPYCENDDGEVVDGGGVILEIPAYTQDDIHANLFYNTRENKIILRDNLRLKIANIIKKSKLDGRFVYPFFVRYAVKMYDGKYIMQSAPILMLPSTSTCPILSLISLFMGDIVPAYNTGVANIDLKYTSKALKLKYKGFFDGDGNDITSTIDEWKDIVSSVDIFLSSQIVTYNDRYYDDVDNFPETYYHTKDGEIANPDYGFSYCNNTKEVWFDGTTSPAIGNYVDKGFDVEDRILGAHGYYRKHYFLPLPNKSKDSVIEEIVNTRLFYKIKSYDLNEMPNVNDTKYLHNEIEYGTLESLETYPTLPDDYMSRCKIAGEVNYNFNQRLVLGNLNAELTNWYPQTKTFNSNTTSIIGTFKIEKTDKTIYVKGLMNDVGNYDFGHFIYYPDVDCTEFLFKIGSDAYVVPMKQHEGLNGAYALMPNLQSLHESISNFEEYEESDFPIQSGNRYYSLPNTIMMSAVANPFYFSADNFKDIGKTKILGIAANVLDVSYGQWGQFPLYAFCNDGIVALTIKNDGNFGDGTSAVSSDILIRQNTLGKNTLVQTNQMLVFLTQQGVKMLVTGSQPKLISGAMNGRHFATRNELQNCELHIGAFTGLLRASSDDVTFRDFVSNGYMAYDYAHNRVILFHDNKRYQYVYTIDNGLWSKQTIYLPQQFQVSIGHDNNQSSDVRSGSVFYDISAKKPMSAVGNYTEMFIQDIDGCVYKTMNVSDENDSKSLYQYGYFVSRPIRFGTDQYKSLTRVLHRYTHYASSSTVKMMVYGSRDGVSYGRLNTLRGMSYQYFILVVYTYLKPNERYSYLSVDFEQRLTNKLR